MTKITKSQANKFIKMLEQCDVPMPPVFNDVLNMFHYFQEELEEVSEERDNLKKIINLNLNYNNEQDA